MKTCVACTSSAAPCAVHAAPAVDPTAAVLRALVAGGWDVELHNARTTARVTLRPPVSWEGDLLEVHAPTLDEAVAAAWRRAVLEEPGLVVGGRMAGLP